MTNEDTTADVPISSWTLATGTKPGARDVYSPHTRSTAPTITATVGCYPDYVSRWKQRFEAERLAGLRAKYRGQPPTVRTPALEAGVGEDATEAA